jgi:Fe-S-cluster-containing hydrogenase component 2
MIFGRIKKLSNVLMKKINKIEVEANKCLKIRAVTSSCTACMDICPANSIEMSQDFIELNGSCLDCGLCTAVCPTNALKWNHPPHIQFLNQIKRLAKNEAEVYIACTSTMNGTVRSNVVEVPCLGMLPMEFWMNVGLYVSNLTIIHHSEGCSSCLVSEGERLFLEQIGEAENVIKHTFPVYNSINQVENDGLVNHNRRRFLTSLLEDVKETNTITVKEVLEVEKTLSPFEKFEQYYQQHDDMEELVGTVEEIKNNVMDKFLNDTVIHTDKRAMLFRGFEKNPELMEQMTFSIPEMKKSCTRCGACALLCPTDSMVIDNETMILSTHKCISCGLCEEICYEKHIYLTKKRGIVFKEKYTVLLK